MAIGRLCYSIGGLKTDNEIYVIPNKSYARSVLCTNFTTEYFTVTDKIITSLWRVLG